MRVIKNYVEDVEFLRRPQTLNRNPAACDIFFLKFLGGKILTILSTTAVSTVMVNL